MPSHWQARLDAWMAQKFNIQVACDHAEQEFADKIANHLMAGGYKIAPPGEECGGLVATVVMPEEKVFYRPDAVKLSTWIDRRTLPANQYISDNYHILVCFREPKDGVEIASLCTEKPDIGRDEAVTVLKQWRAALIAGEEHLQIPDEVGAKTHLTDRRLELAADVFLAGCRLQDALPLDYVAVQGVPALLRAIHLPEQREKTFERLSLGYSPYFPWCSDFTLEDK